MNKHINAENIYIFYLIDQIDKNSPKQKPLLKTMMTTMKAKS